jgi:hypothetical protein
VNNILSKIFKRKQPETMTEIMRKNEVNWVANNFMESHLNDTDGIIIIWAAKGMLFYDCGGIETGAEARGILSYCDDMIREEGLPYHD